MNIEVLLSTMNLHKDKEVDSLIKTMNINTKYLIINQNENKTEIKNKNVISINEKGLSKSRNLAIKKSKADIVILADDDVIYENDYEETIKKAYKENPKADIICFYVESKNKKRKVKRIVGKNVGKLKIMRISSFQITMKKDKIKEIKFDENFGSGAKYDRGEEAIFLKDCLEKGLKIIYINKKIAQVEQSKSTWFKGFTKEYFLAQGKVFKRLYPKHYKLICYQFAIRKYFLYYKKVKLNEAIKLMIK